MNRLLTALKKTKEQVALNNKGICGNVQYYIHEMTKHLGLGDAAANQADAEMAQVHRRIW